MNTNLPQSYTLTIDFQAKDDGEAALITSAIAETLQRNLWSYNLSVHGPEPLTTD